jgi:hypothetical protein
MTVHTTTPDRLQAECRYLHRVPDDPLHSVRSGDVVYATSDVVMVGSGIALTLGIDDGLDSMSFDSVTASLSSIDCEDDVGRPASGVLAFGAIPFDRASPSFLTIPQRLRVYSSDGPSPSSRTVSHASKMIPPDQNYVSSRPTMSLFR